MIVERRSVLSSAISAAVLLTVGGAARGSDLTIEGFRDEVLQVGRRRIPGMPLSAGPGTNDILSGGHHLYVDSIYRLIQSRSLADREQVIVGWLQTFSPAATAKADAITAASVDWATARPLIRPKMMPQAVVRGAPQLVHQPFSPGLVVGYSIDLGDKDLYVSDARFAPWHVTLAEVHDAAIGNLEAMSSKVAIDVKRFDHVKGGVTFIETGDGYDASRILLPAFRDRLLAALGSVAEAAIPGRDLFVAWSSDYELQADLIDRVHGWATTMSRPLSDEVFTLDRAGIAFACRPDRTPRPETGAGQPIAPSDLIMRCDAMSAK